MNKKYFFFDIDGTLAPGLDKVVPESTKRCLTQLRARGHELAIATGRLQKDAWLLARTLGIRHMVSDGGNSLTVDGEIVQMESLPKEACRTFLETLSARNIPWAVNSDNEMVRWTPFPVFSELVGDSYFRTILRPMTDLATCKRFYKLFVYAPNGVYAHIPYGTLPAVPYGKATLLIEPTRKGEGIQRLMNLLNAPISDVVVFGDGVNDLGMFRPEWHSIAMGNAKAVLKEKADYVTANSDEDGICKACHHFGWL